MWKKNSSVFLLQVIGPDNKDLYVGSRESNGKFTFAAHIDGNYRFCFSNAMSTMTPKILMFSLDIGNTPKTNVEDTQGRAFLTFSANKQCFEGGNKWF